MTWQPSELDKNQTKTTLRTRSAKPRITDAMEQDRWWDILKTANSKSQAKALAENVGTLEDLRLLKAYGFGQIKNNSTQAIGEALSSAPAWIKEKEARDEEERVAAELERREREQTDLRINGYLETISGKCQGHMRGEAITLPLSVDGVVVADLYRNGERILPHHRQYIEWYAQKHGGGRSFEKRFFTGSGIVRLYYTEGGTHRDTDKWYERRHGTTTWDKI